MLKATPSRPSSRGSSSSARLATKNVSPGVTAAWCRRDRRHVSRSSTVNRTAAESERSSSCSIARGRPAHGASLPPLSCHAANAIGHPGRLGGTTPPSTPVQIILFRLRKQESAHSTSIGSTGGGCRGRLPPHLRTTARPEQRRLKAATRLRRSSGPINRREAPRVRSGRAVHAHVKSSAPSPSACGAGDCGGDDNPGNRDVAEHLPIEAGVARRGGSLPRVASILISRVPASLATASNGCTNLPENLGIRSDGAGAAERQRPHSADKLRLPPRRRPTWRTKSSALPPPDRRAQSPTPPAASRPIRRSGHRVGQPREPARA